MSIDDVRKGVTNAHFNASNANFLFGQIILLAIAGGLYSESWWVFGAILISLIIFLRVKILALIVVFSLSAGWGFAGYIIGAAVGSSGASEVLAIVAFLSALGLNFSGLQWANDIAN
jgi:hypothetical protein